LLELAACTVRAFGAEIDTFVAKLLGACCQVINRGTEFFFYSANTFLRLIERIACSFTGSVNGFLAEFSVSVKLFGTGLGGGRCVFHSLLGGIRSFRNFLL
jgi:hypothetical protein